MEDWLGDGRREGIIGPMVPWYERPLGLRVGDWISWKDEEIVLPPELAWEIQPSMVGKVVMVSENRLARLAKAEGLPVDAGAWALVEFESGAILVVDARHKFEWLRVT